jgi:hypothetical protein
MVGYFERHDVIGHGFLLALLDLDVVVFDVGGDFYRLTDRSVEWLITPRLPACNSRDDRPVD